MNKVYVGSIGTAIVCNFGEDVSAATTIVVNAKKPNGDEVTWPGTLVAPTTARYLTQAGTLDMPGTWKIQPVVTMPDGEWPGETVPLPVYARFK